MEETIEKKKLIIPLEDLLNQGWEDTKVKFAHLSVYKIGNSRIFYNTRNQTIDRRYSVGERHQ